MKMTVRIAGLVAMVSFAANAQNQGITPEQMQQMQKALGALTAAAQSGGTKPVVDFRELKALLPKELPGGLKGQLKGQKSGAMGMTVSEAEGRYSKDGGNGSITIKLSDISGTGALGAMAHAAWATAEIDNETDDSYEKTTTISGYKGMEKYNKKDKDGEIHLFIDNRFIVEIRGSDIKIEDLKGALGAVDLKKIAALKPAAPAPATP